LFEKQTMAVWSYSKKRLEVPSLVLLLTDFVVLISMKKKESPRHKMAFKLSETVASYWIDEQGTSRHVASIKKINSEILELFVLLFFF